MWNFDVYGVFRNNFKMFKNVEINYALLTSALDFGVTLVIWKRDWTGQQEGSVHQRAHLQKPLTNYTEIKVK